MSGKACQCPGIRNEHVAGCIFDIPKPLANTGVERVEVSLEYRWNPTRECWEFHAPAWGGWCVLRQGQHITTPAMTFSEGIIYLAQQGHDDVLETLRAGLADRVDAERWRGLKAHSAVCSTGPFGPWYLSSEPIDAPSMPDADEIASAYAVADAVIAEVRSTRSGRHAPNGESNG